MSTSSRAVGLPVDILLCAIYGGSRAGELDAGLPRNFRVGMGRGSRLVLLRTPRLCFRGLLFRFGETRKRNALLPRSTLLCFLSGPSWRQPKLELRSVVRGLLETMCVHLWGWRARRIRSGRAGKSGIAGQVGRRGHADIARHRTSTVARDDRESVLRNDGVVFRLCQERPCQEGWVTLGWLAD